MIKQISVLIENTKGTMADVTKTLAGGGVSLKAFSVYDTADFGILRMVVDNNEKAKKVLEEGGFGYTITDVLAVELDDKPGALDSLLETLKDSYNINYSYSMVLNQNGKPLLILAPEPKDGVEDLLRDRGFKVYDMEQD